MTIHVEYLGGPAHGTVRAYPHLENPLPRLYVGREAGGSGALYRRLGHVPAAGGRWQYVTIPDVRLAPTAPVPASPVPAHTALLAAVTALAHALDVVGTSPRAPALCAALDQVEAALTALGDDPTTRALARLVEAVDHCRSANTPGSSALDSSFRAASVALHIDDRWGPTAVCTW